MDSDAPMEPKDSIEEARLNEMFRAYRAACPDLDAGPNFMPNIWARIEARENSTTWFGSVAKALVTGALAASVILGMISSTRQSNAYLNATFVEALRADHASTLEPLQLDRISELESR
ncbi:MAG: hypothetical protein M3N93_01290 [Acidobacteriota bacterium]|nr:hypothetical protein [Acidobacteriota bacterium]